MAEDIELKHETLASDRGRFVLERLSKEVGELTYRSAGSRVYADHTFVDPELRGGRIASRLVEALVAWAKAEGKQIVPECSYVHAWFTRHPEWQSLLADNIASRK